MDNPVRNCMALTMLIVISFHSHAATLEVSGNVEQDAKLKNVVMTAVSAGPGAVADVGVNSLRGSVKVGGSVKQSADLKNVAMSSIATGPGSKAETNINNIQGR